MKRAAKAVSFAALAGTIVPPVLFFYGQVDLEVMKAWMLASAVAWFAATPLWMSR
jgi:TM2 domain-containing membrane protein YozV